MNKIPSVNLADFLSNDVSKKQQSHPLKQNEKNRPSAIDRQELQYEM